MLRNDRKFFIHRVEDGVTSDVIVMCNEWNIEIEKRKLPAGKYLVIGSGCNYNFEK